MKRIIVVLGLLMLPLSGALGQSIFPTEFELCDGPGRDAICESRDLESIDPQDQELWLRTSISIDASMADANRPFGIHFSAMASSEIFWDGEVIGMNGQPAASREQEVAGLMDYVLYLPETLFQPGVHVLVLHISSHRNIMAVVQPIHYVGIAPYVDPQSLRLSYYLPALLTVGGLLLGAFYFGTAFAFDRKDLGALFLALISISVVGQLAAELSRSVVAYTYPWHVPRLIAVALCAWGFSVSLNGYVAWRFARHRLALAIGFTAGLGALAILLMPSFDTKAAAPVLVGSLVALAVLLIRRRTWTPAVWIAAAAIGMFPILIVVRQSLFLDRDFYLAVLVLCGVLFVGELMARKRERGEKAVALTRTKELEIELLRRQISPHFLLNTLNTLSAWVEEDPGKSVGIIDALADECRAIDRMSRRSLVALAEEIDLCRSHLKLMSYRAERSFELNVAGETQGVLIPPVTLLTLIENAFSHNVYEGNVTFELLVNKQQDGTKIEMISPRGREADRVESQGVGLAYIRARFEDAYGLAVECVTERAEATVWRTKLNLPITHE